MTTDIEILVAGDSDVPVHVSDSVHTFATGSNLSLGYLSAASANLAFATRFSSVPIPRLARIKSAAVRLEAASSEAEIVVNARIDGLLVAHSDMPTHAEFDGGVVGATSHGRNTNNRTRAQIAWSAIAATTAGADYDTPDISLVVQEIISQREWIENNALTLFLGDEGKESDQVDGHLRDALRSGVGPRLIVTFAVSEDPAIFEVSLGEVPQTLARMIAAGMRRGEQAQVE